MNAVVTTWLVRPTAHVDLACLSRAERAAAEQLGSETARQRHLRSRAVLRHLVASVTGTRAAHVRLVAPSGAPPRIEGRTAPAVSLAHAEGTIAAAVSGSGPVGVDVELVGTRSRPVPAVTLTDERHAAAADLVEAELVPLAVWVLVEAALKAAGTGFRTPQQRVRFAPAPGGVWLDVPGHGRHGAVVRVLPGGVVLAIATPGGPPTVRVLDPRTAHSSMTSIPAGPAS